MPLYKAPKRHLIGLEKFCASFQMLEGNGASLMSKGIVFGYFNYAQYFQSELAVSEFFDRKDFVPTIMGDVLQDGAI